MWAGAGVVALPTTAHRPLLDAPHILVHHHHRDAPRVSAGYRRQCRVGTVGRWSRSTARARWHRGMRSRRTPPGSRSNTPASSRNSETGHSDVRVRLITPFSRADRSNEFTESAGSQPQVQRNASRAGRGGAASEAAPIKAEPAAPGAAAARRRCSRRLRLRPQMRSKPRRHR